MELVPIAIQGLSMIGEGGLHGHVCHGDCLSSQTYMSSNPSAENYEHKVMPSDDVWQHLPAYSGRGASGVLDDDMDTFMALFSLSNLVYPFYY